MKTTEYDRQDPVLGKVHVIEIDPGRTVVCDLCNQDFTNSPQSGGFLFGGKGVGPCCADRFRVDVRRYDEEHFIRVECPAGKSFADWVREDLR